MRVNRQVSAPSRDKKKLAQSNSAEFCMIGPQLDSPHRARSDEIDEQLGVSFLSHIISPNSEDLNAKRLAFHSGPCWIKLLVADRVAGSIIGKGGRVITEIEQICGCIMKLSPSTFINCINNKSLGQIFFPGTQERIVVISGCLEGISQSLRVILLKIRQFVVSEVRGRQPAGSSLTDSQADPDIDISVRAVVPNSAVSCIIGRGGEVVKEINRITGAMVRIGDRMSIVHERIVQVTGTVDQCHLAMSDVVNRIQSDKNLKEHLNVVYTKAAMHSNRPLAQILSPTAPSAQPSSPALQVQTPSGPLPINMFSEVLAPSMYSQPCSISLSLPPGTISTSVLRKVESQTGASIRFRQSTGSVQISGAFGLVNTAHILLLKETNSGGVFTPPHQSQETATSTPSPTANPPRLPVPPPPHYPSH